MSLATLKKGDTVILNLFTGVPCGVKTIEAADKNTVSFETRAGISTFSKKTGKQISPEPRSPRFASYITEDDGNFVPHNKKKPDSKKKAVKAEPVKPSRKVNRKATKPVAKKAKPEYDEE